MSERDSTSAAAALERLKSSPFDETAWRVIYREYWPLVATTVAHALARHDDVVEDVTQQTFLRLLRAGPASDFRSVDALRAYLRIVALNEARSYLRSQRREAGVLGDASEAAHVPASRSWTADYQVVEAEELASLLATLEESDRELVRYLVRGFSLGEIAAALKITYSAAGVRVHRLRRKLSKSLSSNNLP
jgi:RNA polymerase sigma factor (sigma-70 family)